MPSSIGWVPVKGGEGQIQETQMTGLASYVMYLSVLMGVIALI